MKQFYRLMHKITELLHAKISIDGSDPVVTPIFQNSAFESTSPYFYTRKNNPNIAELELVMLTLEESNFSVCCTTGMAAISMVLHLLKPGDVLVVNQLIYGCSYQLFELYCAQFNIELHFVNLSDEQSVKNLPANTSMVLFETPTNPFLKTVNVQMVSNHVKSKNPNAIIVVDNTWATPLYQMPLKLGADIALYSATKYFSGHSDVMGGVINVNDADLNQRLKDIRFYQGSILDPNSAWLLKRSMQTFEIRMKMHQEQTVELCKFLENHVAVDKVYYPDVDRHQLTGYGALLFFDLRDDLIPKYSEFISQLQLFDTGTGMACVTSMVAKPYTGSHASMSAEDKQKMGLTEKLIRLSIGLEKTEDLILDLSRAFETILKSV